MNHPSMYGNADVTGIILAGGKSSRMGLSKAELSFRGTTLVQWQEQKFRSMGIDQVLISGYGPGMIPDDIPEKGPLGGLYTTMRRARTKRCLVIPVDAPLIPTGILQALLQAHLGGITILKHGDYLEPLIGVYDSCVASSILPMLQSGSTSVRRLLNEMNAGTVLYTDAPDLLMNCNTPEDYAAICSL